jgi:5'-3' exonuclease
MKQMKTACRPTPSLIASVVNWMKEDGIEFYGAAFEAEWQAIHDERQKVVDAVLSVDGDCVVLGVQHLYFMTRFSDLQVGLFDQERIIFDKEYPIAKYHANDWVIIAALLGNDYIANVQKVPRGLCCIHCIRNSPIIMKRKTITA